MLHARAAARDLGARVARCTRRGRGRRSIRVPDGKGAQCESIPTRPLVLRPGQHDDARASGNSIADGPSLVCPPRRLNACFAMARASTQRRICELLRDTEETRRQPVRSRRDPIYAANRRTAASNTGIAAGFKMVSSTPASTSCSTRSSSRWPV